MRVLLVFLALTAAGCTGSSDESGRYLPSTPRTTAPPPTHAVGDASEYAVPPTIDEEYIEKVMRALDHQYGQAARVLAKQRSFGPSVELHLAAVHAPDELAAVSDYWRNETSAVADALAPIPGDPITTVLEIKHATPDCILAVVYRDYSPLDDPELAETSPDRDSLHLTRNTAPPSLLNPTPWLIGGFAPREDDVINPC